MHNVNMAITDKKHEFSARLNKALDEAGFVKPGEGRSVVLAKMMKCSQRGAHKWLCGEAMPRHEKIIQLAAIFNCRSEWLEYGEGEMRVFGNTVAEAAPPEYALEPTIQNTARVGHQLKALLDKLSVEERKTVLTLLFGEIIAEDILDEPHVPMPIQRVWRSRTTSSATKKKKGGAA